MAKFEISFDAKKFQKELESKLKKAQLAATLNMQPEFEGVKMLDKMCEDALATILQKYDGNDCLEANGNYGDFPKYMKLSIGDIFEKLQLSGIIASGSCYLNGWHVYLTPNGITYFEDKKRYEEGRKPMFNKLPTNSKELLEDILCADNPSRMLSERFEKCNSKEDSELRSLLRELIEKEYIIIRWAEGIPMFVEINNSARTYGEQEAEYERQLKLSSGPVFNIGNITNQNGVVAFGDISNSTISIDGSIKCIENKIENEGGVEKADLHALLIEAKEIIENINSSRHIPKNNGFIVRLSSHIEKHSWFYQEIIGLIGTATLKLLQG